ncbi:MAG: hypothetical protein HC888_14440 [Candidatus Competibacteraceae bacterium]|nr:hypothetical protein [Candidatus Competibacteraceae bacterium]
MRASPVCTRWSKTSKGTQVAVVPDRSDGRRSMLNHEISSDIIPALRAAVPLFDMGVREL